MTAIVSSRWFRHVAMLLMLTMSVLASVPNVDASFVESQKALPSDMRSADMHTIAKALENKAVTERLAALGYTQNEIDQRLAQLSDNEVRDLASQIDSVTHAGDFLGVIIAVLIIVLLVVVILKLSDKRIIVD